MTQVPKHTETESPHVLQTYSQYHHPLSAAQSGHASPWPSRLAQAFSEDPSQASESLSREFETRMSLDERSSMEEAHSTVSVNNHHATSTIAEEEQEDLAELDKQGANPSWADAAPAAAAVGTGWGQVNAGVGAGGGPGAGESGEAGQNWNWPWLTGQLASEHSAMDPNALLDDESEGESVLSLSKSRPIDGCCSYDTACAFDGIEQSVTLLT